MKKLRVQLPVLDLSETEEVLDLVSSVEGVVAVLMDERAAALDVVLASDAIALHVREQLWALTHSVPLASA